MYTYEPAPNGTGHYNILDEDENVMFAVVDRGDMEAAIEILNDLSRNG